MRHRISRPDRTIGAVPHRCSRVLAVVALAALGASGAPGAGGEPEPKREGVTCRHWAVLLPEDAGQHRIYDGIRKGLELAQMERVCLKEVEDTEASFKDLVAWHATLPKPEPLLFAIGRRAGARLVAAGYAGPGVLISTEVTVKGEPLAPEPALGPRMARVRAEIPAEVLGNSVRELLAVPPGARPLVEGVSAMGPFGVETEPFERFLQSAGLRANALGVPDSPEAKRAGALAHLHVRLPFGFALEPFESARKQAYGRRVPIVSDDPARFGTGATLVIVPDHQRVGRTAAEAGRRLWQNEPDALGKPLVVRTTEVWVDLVAAQEIGLEPPLTFLAAADRVRAPPKKAAPAPGAPGVPPPAGAPR
jgi:hypothetical protein